MGVPSLSQAPIITRESRRLVSDQRLTIVLSLPLFNGNFAVAQTKDNTTNSYEHTKYSRAHAAVLYVPRKSGADGFTRLAITNNSWNTGIKVFVLRY